MIFKKKILGEFRFLLWKKNIFLNQQFLAMKPLKMGLIKSTIFDQKVIENIPENARLQAESP